MCAVPVGHFFPFRPSFGTARGAPSLQSRFTQFAWPAQTSFPPGAPSNGLPPLLCETFRKILTEPRIPSVSFSWFFFLDSTPSWCFLFPKDAKLRRLFS